MITPEAQKVLNLEKERSGEPFVQIINRAITNIGKAHPSIPEKTAPRSNIPEKTVSGPKVPEKTTPSSGKSAKVKKRAGTSDKKTAQSPEQLSLFLGTES